MVLTGSPGLLPIPSIYDPGKVERVWRVDYDRVQNEGKAWARTHGISRASSDRVRVGMLLIDVQDTFCNPEGELYVGGKDGRAAVEDNQRLCEYLYRNMAQITKVHTTMDTHRLWQIFHPLFWVDAEGKNPPGFTMITHADVKAGKYRVNPDAVGPLGGSDYMALQHHVDWYTAQLERDGRYVLMVWPYHAMLGGLGHIIVPSVHEAICFIDAARSSQSGPEIKGGHQLTEYYSVLGPEVVSTGVPKKGSPGELVETPLANAGRNFTFIDHLLDYDVLVVTGQALSHCVLWTLRDLQSEIAARDPGLAKKVHIVRDCSSSIWTPDYDFGPQTERELESLAASGMRIVTTATPIAELPGYREALDRVAVGGAV
jgi:nicotinamidase-related amidase